MCLYPKNALHFLITSCPHLRNIHQLYNPHVCVYRPGRNYFLFLLENFFNLFKTRKKLREKIFNSLKHCA